MDDMKKELLSEMKKMNKASEDRTGRLEKTSNDYESLIKELHENNKLKAAEMAQYETRLT